MDKFKVIEKIESLLKGNDNIPVLIGPTAIGKTGLAIELSLKLGLDIISADSRMVYKKMDIGTSKPTLEERKGVKHHLIDLVYPDESYNAAEFKTDCYEMINRLKKDGKKPLIVGGTMLYIDAVCNDYNLASTLPNSEIREMLEEKSTAELYEMLKNLDPKHAESISYNNRPHIIRPLEVVLSTGNKYSDQIKKGKSKFPFLKIGLIMNRSNLYKKINQRVEDQLEMGLLEETKMLAETYDYSLPSMTGLGYKQMGYYLRGEMSFLEAKEILKRDTRHFAKRQLTWWKRDDTIKWINV